MLWSPCIQAALQEGAEQAHKLTVLPSQQKQGTSSPHSRTSVWVRELGHGCLVWNSLRDMIRWCSRDTSHNKPREDNAVAL